MHVHACYVTVMRTTVEISDSHRARLLKLAADRGEKGFSHLVREALDRYLDADAERTARVNSALSVIGSFSETQADALAREVRRLRATWR